MDQTTVSYIVAAGSICGIISAYWGYSRGAKKDTYSAGAKTGEQQADITYIKQRTDDILLEQRDTNRKLEGHSTQLSDHAVAIARIDESTKSAHLRLNQLCNEKGNGQ
ncbi:conserved hypothetical protein [Candidatus Desulfosporosinus infrequens]|uniref:Uncharacterized protein n=1 Tax=Candidatus Desulfosporosinus infrequens TaxID=2043169 RepID=A0A2U3LH04_9FIRM|nr:conserved hypothetical protein [Candidatus Desulfosporosinus infrequens]